MPSGYLRQHSTNRSPDHRNGLPRLIPPRDIDWFIQKNDVREDDVSKRDAHNPSRQDLAGRRLDLDAIANLVVWMKGGLRAFHENEIHQGAGGVNTGMATKLRLKPGRFYVTKDGSRWCCFRVDERNAPHCQAFCIEVNTQRVEYFYIDGRYDDSGQREHTLIEEAVYAAAS